MTAKGLKVMPSYLRKKWKQFLSLPIDSPKKAVYVAFLVSFFAGLMVSVSNVLLKPIEQKNKENSQREYLLQVFENKSDIKQLISASKGKNIQMKIVNLSSGKFSDTIQLKQFDPLKAARDPLQSTAIPPHKDIAKLKRRADLALVYIVGKNDTVRYIILPVYGKGYISTLYGYLGLDIETNTVIGLSFYQHGETPGLGGQLTDSSWEAQWMGKKIRDDDGAIRLGVSRGIVARDSAEFAYMVDGLSGASKTSIGVHHLLRFWLGDWGFGPFLECIRTEGCQ